MAWIEAHVVPGDVLYDIGANVGTFSLIAATRLGGRGQVLAFEPGYASFARLCDNIILNDCADVVFPIGLPLSSRTGIAQFAYRSVEPGQSRHNLEALQDPATRGPSRKRYRQPVLAFRLDELVERFDLPRPTHIKIDVDGGELLVLEGADRVLRGSTLRTLLIEVAPMQSDAVVAILRDRGYALAERHQGAHQDGTPKPVWYGLFTRAG